MLWLATNVVGVHALRVSVFVLGRTGPWLDLDVRAEQRAQHAATWTWAGVYAAASLSALSVLVTAAIAWFRRAARRAELVRAATRKLAPE